ncbi:MAG: hydantoinase/oxoprolinase family protein [Gammaproteobacteria bacterium]|nr:hydantoinase/oxoprolinase family protein [Gammaproteobacteria bacterium]
MKTHWLGVDTGGTFTDFVYFNGKSIVIHKVLSTPLAPEQAILQGISELGVPHDGLQLIHGSTVATNAVLEAKGVKTVYITNSGFSDVLTIGRQARRDLYNLMPKPAPPLIPADYCMEINTRLNAKGELLQALKQHDIQTLLDATGKIKPDAIAINLLFSFLDNKQELEIRKQLVECFDDIFVTCSSDVLPEYKEYERGIVTALNAYVGPLMQGYLNRLQLKLEEGVVGDTAAPCLSVLQSSADTIKAEQAGNHAVRLLLSGPAGGLKGASYVAGLAGENKLLSFDMGGTSTDVALIDGEIKLSSEGRIGEYPVAVPMVDMHTIGAGGGSITYVDAGGLLNVGPESAGAVPGPACYGQGGQRATVTDANLILGRLQVNAFLGEGMQLDIDAAKEAMQKISITLGLSVEAAAEGVIKIANEHMVRALRSISVQRGYDPQGFVLTCFGGAGGLHVCALADALSMRRAIVPVHGGVLSALGMLVAAPGRELSVSCIQLLAECDCQVLEKKFARLESRGVDDMAGELMAKPKLQRSVDLRYKGQSFTLNLKWCETHESTDFKNLEQLFHEQHKSTYGHRLDLPVELVNLRVSINGDVPPFELPVIKTDKTLSKTRFVNCYGIEKAVGLFQRDELNSGQKITGPALILEKVSTTLIDVGWYCVVDDWGNLLLYREV